MSDRKERSGVHWLKHNDVWYMIPRGPQLKKNETNQREKMVNLSLITSMLPVH